MSPFGFHLKTSNAQLDHKTSCYCYKLVFGKQFLLIFFFKSLPARLYLLWRVSFEPFLISPVRSCSTPFRRTPMKSEDGWARLCASWRCWGSMRRSWRGATSRCWSRRSTSARRTTNWRKRAVRCRLRSRRDWVTCRDTRYKKHRNPHTSLPYIELNGKWLALYCQQQVYTRVIKSAKVNHQNRVVIANRC